MGIFINYYSIMVPASTAIINLKIAFPLNNIFSGAYTSDKNFS